MMKTMIWCLFNLIVYECFLLVIITCDYFILWQFSILDVMFLRQNQTLR